jgi:hypothetical protein
MSVDKIRIANRIAKGKTSELVGQDPDVNPDLKNPESVSGHNDLIDIPNVRQYNDFTCGSACLLAILAYYGKYDGREDDLASELRTNPINGTNADDIVKIARKFGLNAERRENADLKIIESSLRRKTPIIVNFQAWSDSGSDYRHSNEDGHYAIVTGMDDENLYFRDPSMNGKIGRLSKADFMQRWHDEDAQSDVERMCILFHDNMIPRIEEIEYIG